MEFEDLWIKTVKKRWYTPCGSFYLVEYKGDPNIWDCGCLDGGKLATFFEYFTRNQSECHKKFIKDNPHVTKNLYSLLYIGK